MDIIGKTRKEEQMKYNFQDQLEDIIKKLESNITTGLTKAEVKKRQQEYGFNELQQKQRKSIGKMVVEQLTDKMILILLTASILSFLLGEQMEGFVILFIICLNIIISVVQEKKASDALESLKNMNAPHSYVLRESKKEKILAKDLVPGDIVFIEAGDIIPADIRWIETHQIIVDESALTGESIPVEKNEAFVATKELPLGERDNMGYSSTIVGNGTALGIVTATGMSTEIGMIAQLLDTEELQTPLKKKLNHVGKVLSILGIIISILIFIIGLWHGKDLISILMIAISLAISVIPEGLPATVTVVMAIGVQRMAKKHALVKNLPAVETLGSASVICTDKTGTLTENKMTVTTALMAEELVNHKETKVSEEFIRCAVLCNNATINKKEVQGDPTEGALLFFAEEEGYSMDKIKKEYHKEYEKPFDSDRKLMTVICKKEESIAYSKGAVEELLSNCKTIVIDNKVQRLTHQMIKDILTQCEELSQQALRIIALAKKEKPTDIEKVEEELTFLGIVGMMDPPRKEVMKSIQSCHEAGIKVIMITGDHKATAVAIAKKLGIYREGDLAVNVEELHQMSKQELKKTLSKISVFSRVSPKDKLDIVKALQSNAEIVGMTGDGVNDAPALNVADIGIAMGKNGTDVAKEAADVLLLDDNFSTIEIAVEEGRRIYRNIQKVIQFLLTGNIAEVLTIFLAIVGNLQTPILAVHILFVNLITDTLPALALGVDPANKNTMRHPPVKKGTLFEKSIVANIGFYGIFLTLLSFIAYFIGIKTSYKTAITMTFIVLSMSQIIHALNQHSNTISIFSKDHPKNKFLYLAMAVSALLLFAVVFIPGLNNIFSIVPLTGKQWIIIFTLSLSPLLLSELMKIFRREDDTI